MPIYNEAPARVFAAMQAICEDVARDRPRRGLRLFLPVRHDRPGRLDRRRARAGGDPRAPAGTRASTIATGARTLERKAGNIADFVTRWGGAYAYGGARRRQPDDRRRHRSPRRRDGGGPGRRHHPEPAADRQPQHVLRARCSNSPRASPGRSSPRGLSAWMGRRRQLLGPQRDHPHARLRRPLRPAGPARHARRSAAISSATISSRRR